MEDIDYQIHDAIMERPCPFSIGEDIFYIYPQTLGKMFLSQRIFEQMSISQEHLQTNVTFEMFRVAKEHRDLCCDLLSYMTARNEYHDVFDLQSFNKRKSVFLEQSDEDLASVLMLLMTMDKTAQFIKHLKIDKEQEAMQAVMKVKSKSDKNNFNFGGVSIYGSLIDVTMERYKMSKRQVVWEIDYTSLRLLLADKVNSIYVTDDELEKIPANLRNRNDEVIKPTKENMERILAMDWR